jgi:hypothetical protein
MTEDKRFTYAARINAITSKAIDNKIPVKKALDIYSKLNYQVYLNNNDFSGYNPKLEQLGFSFTKFILNRLN